MAPPATSNFHMIFQWKKVKWTSTPGRVLLWLALQQEQWEKIEFSYITTRSCAGIWAPKKWEDKRNEKRRGMKWPQRRHSTVQTIESTANVPCESNLRPQRDLWYELANAQLIESKQRRGRHRRFLDRGERPCSTIRQSKCAQVSMVCRRQAQSVCLPLGEYQASFGCKLLTF